MKKQRENATTQPCIQTSRPLSAQLWLKFTPAKVILQIVYSETEVSEELSAYKQELVNYGVIVYLVPTGPDIKCVLKSQVIRILAYNLPYIQDQDVIVTADVDAFIMNTDIYKPLQLPQRKIWIFQYTNALYSHWTFAMSFIGIKKSVWKRLFIYDSSEDDLENGLLGTGIPKMIKTYEKRIYHSNNTWNIDQDIFTHSILNSGLCSLPKSYIMGKTTH